MLIGLTVPGPVFSISAYTAPLAGSTRSTSAPLVPWLLIWMVCQPGPGTDQPPPHSALLTLITFDGWPPPELHAVRLAASAAPTAANCAARRRLVPMGTNDRHRFAGDVGRDGAEFKRSPAPQLPDTKKSKAQINQLERTR